MNQVRLNINNQEVEANEGTTILEAAKRQENLVPILARHCHASLSCAQKEDCPRTQCSSNVPENGWPS